MAEEGVEALLITNLTNVRYACGYVGSNGSVLLSPQRRVLFTDFRYLAAAREQTDGVEVVESGRDLFDKLAETLDGLGATRVGFEAEHTSVSKFERLRTRFTTTELVATSGMVEAVRRVKDADEIACMARAAEITDHGFAACRDGLFVGRTEKQVAWELEGILRDHGAEAPSFGIIVASGANGARPHAVPSDTRIPKDSLVTIDMGSIVDGYVSDCTRTFATGSLPDALAEAYAVCLTAQERALAAVRPGITGGDLDKVARDHIAAAGLGDAFRHSLGHGAGLEVHEEPYAREGLTDVIDVGMTVTIEPGIYLDGVGGVRIEDLVVLTQDGCRVLTPFTKELLTVDS
jgi:Xaa-Pro aminopeptidase